MSVRLLIELITVERAGILIPAASVSVAKTTKSSILIAIAQGLAAIPGFSRSGLTIATGLLSGSDRTTSKEDLNIVKLAVSSEIAASYFNIVLDDKLIKNYEEIAKTSRNGYTKYILFRPVSLDFLKNLYILFFLIKITFF